MDIWQIIIPSGITIIGLFLSYIGIQRNFTNEIRKFKSSIALNKLSNLPLDLAVMLFNITKLMNNIDDYKKMISQITAYGTKEAVEIVAVIQQKAYKGIKSKEDSLELTALFSILLSQIKKDLTTEIMKPSEWLKITLNDYENNEDQLTEIINNVIEKYKFNNCFKLN